MLIIQDEDKRSQALQTTESRTITGQGDGIEMGRIWSIPVLTNNRHIDGQKILVEQIIKELENEEKDEREGKQTESALNAHENIDQLGILMNQRDKFC